MIPNCFKILFFSFVVILISCKNPFVPQSKAGLAGTWRLNSEESLQKNAGDILGDDTISANVLSFFPDGSYTQFVDSGKMDYGQWKLSKDHKMVTLVSSGNPVKTFP